MTKKTARTSCICLAAVALLAPRLLFAQTDGTVTFRVKTEDPEDVSYSPRNCMAIWVTTSTGEFVKTLKRRANSRINYLYKWVADSNKDVTDAVTGATISSLQTHNVTWDCRDTSGALVADGTYRMRAEFTTRNGQGPYTPSTYIQFTKGPSPVTLNPSNYDYTSSPYNPLGPEFTNMELVFTPSATPHDIEVADIDVPPSVVAGSTVQVTVTVNNLTATEESGVAVELRNTTTDTLIGTQTITTLAGSGSAQKVFSWNTTGLAKGDYDLTAKAGPVPDEGSTGDNERVTTVTVRAALHDIAATAVRVAARLAPGSVPNVTVAVTNNGDFAESFDVVLSDLTDESVLGTMGVSSLAAGAGQDVVFSWNTRFAAQGVHRLKAVAGPIATEWNLANNAAYAWTAVATGATVRTLVAAASEWEYNDQGIDLHASNWKESTYYASQWSSGDAQLGYGGNGETTVLSYGDDEDNKHPCYYFRKTFFAAAMPEALSAHLVRDDGAVVYINGIEACRDKIAAGPTQYDQYAIDGAVGGDDETTFFPFTLDPSLVVPGENVVAVELHQINATSSDLGFDFALTSTVPAWTVQPDVAVTDVALHDGIAGDVIDVDVAVANRGNAPASFTVSLSNLDGGGLVGSEPVADLMPGAVEHVGFDWSTLGLTPGDYRLEGLVSGMSGDVNTGNDALTATGTVTASGFAAATASVAGSIGGFCEDAVVDGNRAYLVAGASLVALDVTTPASPTVLDCLHLTGIGKDIEIADSHVYVACGEDGVQIVDISSPTALTHRVTYDTSGAADDVALAGTTLYIADGARGLRILDVTTPASPVLRSVTLTGGAAQAVTVSGTTVYVADDKGVLILNAADPTAPAEMGRVMGLGFGQALALSGTTLYVGDGDGELYVVDASAPASASITGQVRLPGRVEDLMLSGTTVYAAVGVSGVSVVDASTPASPSIDGTITTGNEATGVAWLGSRLCVSDGYAGLRVITTAVPGSTVVGSYEDISRSRSSALSGDYAFLAAGNAGVRVYDVSSPAAPVLAGNATAATNARDVALDDDVLYVADGQYGLALLDVSTPATPALLGRYVSADLGSVRRVAVSGTDAVITDGRRVERIDASTPASPAFTHAYSASGYAYDLAWQGGHVLVAEGRSGLVTLNAADLSVADTLPLSGVAVAVSAAGTNAFVAAENAGWHRVDIRNPAALVLAGTRTSEGNALALAASGGRLHVADDVSMVNALDMSTPLTPVPIGDSGELARCLHLASGSGLVLASEDAGGAALLAGIIDSDGDGLDDTWEQQIVDANPSDGIDSIEDVLPGDDFDGDGLSNGAEAVAGTSPVNADSVFAMVAPGVPESEGEFVLRWHSVAGRTYSILRATDLTAGFSPLATGIAAAPPINAYTTTTTSVSAYFMIAVE
jgi:hypothetical protein